MKSFNELELNENLLKAIQEIGFKIPTEIQRKTIPHLLSSGKDVIATAQTGTGKTAAFGLPSIQLTEAYNTNTQTLVLCPTRELCMQITNDLQLFAKYLNGINVVAVYGGASIDNQSRALRKGAQIVVGTPGRTKDLMKRKRLKLENIERVILDEADEMLSMGFKEDLESILAKMPTEKQTLLFSATMSSKIIAITKQYMHSPVSIEAEKVNSSPRNVKHVYYKVHAKDRYSVLKRVADINPNIYGIIFCRTRKETKEVSNKLMHDGYNADAIHGDLSQAQRDEVMGRFRKRQLQLLVATDVAARGLDVDDLSHVINYNLPDDDETYIHRSGRTGRAGKKGISIVIIHSRETRKIQFIEKKSKITFVRELVPSGKDICEKQLYSLINKIETVKVDEHQIEPFLPSIYKKLDWLSREDLIKHFVSAEFNRFLSYYKNARDLNDYSKTTREKNKKSKSDRRKSTLISFYINLGTKNDLNPARLIGLINEALNSGDAVIGKIEILKKFSFFEIEASMDQKIKKSLQGKEFEGVKIKLEVANEKPKKIDRTKRPTSRGSSGRGRNNRGRKSSKQSRNSKSSRKRTR
jgi:ATP-dependent RNA helicase DeaD